MIGWVVGKLNENNLGDNLVTVISELMVMDYGYSSGNRILM